MKVCWNGSSFVIQFYNPAQRAAMKEANVAIKYMKTEELNKCKERIRQREQEILESLSLEVENELFFHVRYPFLP